MVVMSWTSSISGMASKKEDHLVESSHVIIPVFTAIFFFFVSTFFHYSFCKGKELRRMCTEYHLEELKKHLGGDFADIETWINYLRCCLKMHTMCVRSKLPEDYSYEETILEYKDAFEDVHQLYGVSETLKVHILSGALNGFVALDCSNPFFLLSTFFYFSFCA